MKILDVEIPDELEQGFRLWCKIVKYPVDEKYFIEFLSDAKLHNGVGIEKNNIFYLSETQMNFDSYYVFNLKSKSIAPFLIEFITYLKQIENEYR